MELLSGACDHQTVMKNMCAECGADLEQDMSIVASANKPAKSQISIVHSIPELKISSTVRRVSISAFFQKGGKWVQTVLSCFFSEPEIFLALQQCKMKV